ncbi:MAG: ATP-binding protein [Chthoniobacteraceae bacterium]
MPPNEEARLRVLRQYGLLDTPPDATFDALTVLAGYIFHAPVAVVSLVDENRLWFKASTGLPWSELPRERGFSTYAILDPGGLVVHDAAEDPRFNPGPAFDLQPPLRFYAGAPLLTHEGYALGAICILDHKPRPDFDPRQMRILQTLSRHAMAQIELRHSFVHLTQELKDLNQVETETRRKLAAHEREMDRLSEMKDRFVTMLAHELRNPLASILNAVELLRSPEPEDATEIIETQVRHLSRLTEDLLDLSRVTRGKLVLQKTTLDLVDAVREAAKVAKPVFAKGGQHLVVSLPPQPLWLEADPVRVQQIVSNLLANAAKFTPPGRKVSLALKTEGGEAVLYVVDEGIGLPPEMLERIFDPFVQSEGAGERGGLGLGLPLVRQLVKLHRGHVKAESDGVGKGCRFTVRLPLGIAPAHPIPKPDPLDQAVVRPETVPLSCRVLVVDDNTEFRETLGRLLKRWGHETQGCATGAQALDRALSFQPDIVLIDLNLPDVDGFSVAECLCSRPELTKTHLVAMSGFGEEHDRVHAAQSGFHEFVLKPVDPAFLRSLVAIRAGVSPVAQKTEVN